MAAAHEIHRLQMRKARRLDPATIGLVGPVRDQIHAKFTLGCFDSGINLARRHLVSLGIELEMMDQCFHRALHLAALRRHDLAVFRGNSALPCRFTQLRQALAHDFDRLPHLFHANAITVIIVAVFTHRNVEIHLFIKLIRLRLAQIPRSA